MSTFTSLPYESVHSDWLAAYPLEGPLNKLIITRHIFENLRKDHRSLPKPLSH
jgi:hypothetical protein